MNIIMTPELIAICAAVCWGVESVLVRKGLLTLTITSGLMINWFVSTIILWLFAFLFLPSLSLNSEAIMFFVLVGVIGGFFGVFLFYEGIHRLGAALTSTLLGIYPLFAFLFALIFRGENYLINFSRYVIHHPRSGNNL